MDATLLLKASVVLAASLAGARVLRRGPASLRHQYWTAAIAAVLLLPLLAVALPPLLLPIPATRPAAVEARDSSAATPETPVAPQSVDSRTPAGGAASVERAPEAVLQAPAGPVISRRTLLLMVWAAGSALAAGVLLLSMLRVRRLRVAAEALDDPAWRTAADALARRLGVGRSVRLFVSADVATPMAGGLWQPAVFLPASALRWTPEQRDVVLAHEMAHLASRDPLRLLLARLAVAAYWFHPLAWMVAREAAVAREEACDAAVLALGTRPSVYARVLLDLAGSLQPGRRLVAALPMVQRSLLERRVMQILEDARPAARRFAVIPVIVVASVTLAVAAARPDYRHGLPEAPGVVPEAPVAPNVGSSASAPPAPRPVTVQSIDGGDCWSNAFERSFSGSRSVEDAGGRRTIYEQIGTSGGTRVIQKRFDDLELCLVANGVAGREGAPSQWLDEASAFAMEARRGGAVQRLEGRREGGGAQVLSWRVGGRERPLDAAAQQWRGRMLAVLDTTWELSSLRGHVSSLRGEISSVRGEESSLRGEISSLRGEVSSMRGRISAVRGSESSLRGTISAIRGHVSALRGSISAERGAIASLEAAPYRASGADGSAIAARIARHETEIARLEQEIRAFDEASRIAAVEREIAALDAARKAAEIEAEIQKLDLEARVTAIERRIEALDVAGKVAAIGKRIEALDADRRGRQLEDRRAAEVKQLEAAVAAVR